MHLRGKDLGEEIRDTGFTDLKDRMGRSLSEWRDVFETNGL